MKLFQSLLCTLTVALSACTTQPLSESNRLFPSQTDFSLSAASFEAQCLQQQKSLTLRINALEQQSPQGNRFLGQLDALTIDIENSISDAQLLNNVHPDPLFREMAGQCEQSLFALYDLLGLSEPLYKQLLLVDVRQSDKATRHFYQKLVREFKRSGVDRDAATREQIQTLKADINQLGQQFGKNIRDDVRHITIDDLSHLAGLPDDYIASLPRDEQGRWRISTDYPSALPFFRYADSDPHRKQLYTLFRNRGYPQNQPVLKQLIQKRHQLAQLLGYQHYGDYATETAMVGSAAAAQQFIDRITQLADQRAQRDYATLLAELQQLDPASGEVGDWQKAYLAERVKQREFEIDARELRQYFDYNEVKLGIFKLVEQLFAINIQPWQTTVWHPSVEAFEIVDEREKVIGRFFLDMHPRQGKYKHAAHFGIRTGINGQQLPISALICNFPGGASARAGNSQRALMEHSQVETFLHEFGHLLHSMLGGHQAWSGISGIATERDFVEAPSQLLEEWVWDADSLALISADSAGNPIPTELVERMRQGRHFGRGSDIRTQMFYAALSLNYYTTSPEQLDLTASLIENQRKYSVFDYMPDTFFYANFGHLYGYSARYYTYMWSKVIAADLFSSFKQQGLLDTDLARHYRDTVLAQGGSQPATLMIKNFLGRPFTYDAFIEQLNEE